MADMSKISPDAGQTIYNLKDADARANKWDKSSQKVAGAYNLLHNTWTTAVISNVTVTKNLDGTLSTSGTSSAADDQEIGVATLKAGTYKLVGCPADGGSAAYRLKAVNKTSSDTVIGYDDSSGLIFTLAAEATIGVNLVFASGVPMASKTFKPMITPDLIASYDDYISYCMSNKELTAEVAAARIKHRTFNNNLLSFTSSNSSLSNCTGSISAYFNYEIVDESITVCGRCIITNFKRTGPNPGVLLTLPYATRPFFGFVNGYMAVNSTFRFGENITARTVTGNIIVINSSETYSDLPTTSSTVYLLIAPFTMAIG